MYNESITLIGTQITYDEIKAPVRTETRRELYAAYVSIGKNEFYQAAVANLKPVAKFILSDYMDYQGEKILEHTEFGRELPQRYAITRTYRKGNELEITCEQKIGE